MRYSDDRWKVQVRDICERLGTYSYLEVKNDLKARTRPKMVMGRVVRKRQNVGCFLPTDRQLQQYLGRADYCVEIVEPRKHVPAKYRYVEPTLSTLSTIPGEEGST